MIFGNSEGVTGEGESGSQAQLKETMQKAWATFATDPWRGLETLGWPRYQKSGELFTRVPLTVYGAGLTPTSLPRKTPDPSWIQQQT